MAGIFMQDIMSANDAIRELAECIKDLSCMVGSNGDSFIAERLASVYKRADAIILKDRLV